MKTKKSLTFECLSDTHGYHNKLPKLVGGDVLIFAGDCCMSGSNHDELRSFANWFHNQPHKYKVFVPGNHDKCLDPKFNPDYHRLIKECFYKENVFYLNGSGCEIEGIKIWGEPVVPNLKNWAFYGDDETRAEKWNAIPLDIDVLVTHGPSFGVLDGFPDKTDPNVIRRVGCHILKEKIRSLKNLKAHVFGHIHYSNSKKVYRIENRDLVCINCSICTESYGPYQNPHPFILKKPE